MSTKTDKYQITEKDIDGVIRFLRITDPDHATPKIAIEILEKLYATFHTLNHEDPDTLVKIYEDLRKQKKLSTN